MDELSVLCRDANNVAQELERYEKELGYLVESKGVMWASMRITVKTENVDKTIEFSARAIGSTDYKAVVRKFMIRYLSDLIVATKAELMPMLRKIGEYCPIDVKYTIAKDIIDKKE